jgi:hypothetical protein
MIERHQNMVQEAAAKLIAVADDTGLNLVYVLAEMERHIVQETKVGDAKKNPPPPGQYGYTLEHGRLVMCQ